MKPDFDIVGRMPYLCATDMYSFAKYKEQYRQNLRLALPVVAAQLGQILVQLADNIMVGQYGGDNPLPLASVSFGISCSFLFFITGLGIVLGLTPLAGELFAQGEDRHAASCLKHAIVLYSLLGLAITALQFAFVPAMYRMGQPVEVVEAAIPYYRLLALSMLPVMLFGAYKQFLEGIGNTTVPMIVIVGGNLLNVLLNWVFIFGHCGSPEMGVTGAGLATLVSRIVMPLVIIAWFRLRSDFRHYLSFFADIRYTAREFMQLLKMGFPIAAQMFLESSAFVITGIMTGWFDTVAIGSNQIAITVGNCAFMVVCAIGAAATIRVSHCYGRRDAGELSLAAKASLHIVIVWNALVALSMVVFRGMLPHIFTTNAEIIALTSVMLLYVAAYQIFDGIQCVAIGIMRGIQDVKIIPFISFLAYIVLNLPAGYLCGFTLGIGPQGLYIGYIFGLGTSALLLTMRIRRKIKAMRSGSF